MDAYVEWVIVKMKNSRGRGVRSGVGGSGWM